MAINLDFSSVSDRSNLTPGKYRLSIAHTEQKISSTGNKMISIEFDVLEDAEGNGYGSRKIWENYSLVPKALFKLKNLLSSIGLDVSGALTLDPTELVGQTLLADIGEREYNGDIYNCVKKTYADSQPHDSNEFEPLEAEDMPF